ncbi:Na+/H+ antiporter subunit A [Gleimia sp. 6138-11-ORH1]|uniref:Na+/H+ antiporter subunit A n=1 Tax=Gleimia sp. 6138-11-ORH1 TaxID=2973937 RepID=UPI002168EAB5|nr:Na+/H+ antiporter subunit A [Gleimia sp. 6138-11-ORH1]MCS4484707.1 Na+/H+ antiporter subunit A [Gleimia sp. 6138-11-ORH1]
MLLLLLIQLLSAACAPIITRKLKRNALLVLALPLAATFTWTIWQTPQVFSERPLETNFIWVSGLNLSLNFQLDPLAWLMSLIVTGIGALVMVYASRYFPKNAAGLPRFTAVFAGFAAAMYGLVISNHLMMVYLFWEMTTVLSFLLIGHHYDRRTARAAARQAIHITSAGSLAMFAGFILLAVPHSTTQNYFIISNLLEAMTSGTYPLNTPQTLCGAFLIFIGAASKSALFPNHFWLPGAMAAPTPVSAYLHSAAMVKAGVFLFGKLVPGFTLIPGWSATVVFFGLITMLVGGYRALKQTDLKLVLAYGTVSQLGLISAAIAFGSAPVYAAAIALLLAHSVFKSTLFMTVGLVEKLTGTRDLQQLSGLAKKQPALATVAAVAAASMAGIPPLLGYLGKEALLTAGLFGTEATWITPRGEITFLIALIVGSIFTITYSLRFWWGAFATKPKVAAVTCKPLPAIAFLPLVALAALTFYLPIAQLAANLLKFGEVKQLPGHAHIAYWSGWQPAAVTGIILLAGSGLFIFRGRWAQLQAKLAFTRFKAADTYRWFLVILETIAVRLTSKVQRGSLPADVATITLVLTVLLGFAVGYSLYSGDFTLTGLYFADSPVQAGAVFVAIIATIVTVRARNRLKAVLGLGVIGLTIAVIFIDYGAPDLALTQLVVEVVSLVVFVLVVRHLPKYFSARPLARAFWTRLSIAIFVGLTVVLGALLTQQARVATADSVLIPAEGYVFGAGENIVNVILVDVRAWDTVGELSVVLVTATGVASLIYLTKRTGQIRIKRPREAGKWLPGAQFLSIEKRSLLLEVGTRLLFPVFLVASLWLLLIGHNQPGGGFAGGMLAGIALILRYLAGGRHELRLALPLNPGKLLGLGLFLATLSGILPVLFGDTILQTTEFDIDVFGLGHLHFTSALLLDIGVYVLVVALVLDIILALGAQIEKEQEGA